MSNIESLERETHLTAFYERLGNGERIEMDEEHGRSVLDFTADPDMCPPGGFVQGGYVTAWLDNAMANAALSLGKGNRSMTTLEIKITFLRGVRPGVRMRAEGWIVRAAKKVMFMEAQLTDPDGVVVAKGSSTGQWLDPR